MKTKTTTFWGSLKIWGFALVLTMLLGSSAFSQNYQNRLVNPGFEDGFNTGWSNWMPDNNVIETDLANVHGGAQSVALKPVNWSGSGFGQSITNGFAAGEKFTLSAYGKIVGATTGHISIQLKDADGNKTNINSSDFANTGAFEMQSLVVAIPAGTVEITPNVWYDNNDGSVLYIDDIRFTLEAPDLLVNPGFEDGFASGWSNWMPDNNVVETDPANVHGGAQSVALKPVNWSGSGFGQTITSGFSAGQILIFSGYGKVTGATSGHISVQFKDAGGSKTNVHSADFSNTGAFEMQSLVVAIPAGTVEIVPNIWYDNNDGSILYVDDLRMILQGMNMLVNPDFEDGFANGWSNWMPDNNVVETEPDNVQSGAKSVSLHPVNWSGSGFGQSITTGFTPGEICVFAGYGKVTGATSGHLAIQFKDAAGNKTNMYSSDFAITGTFGMQSLSAVIPEGTVEMIPNLWYDNNDGSVLTVDNFTLSTPYKAPVVTGILGGTGLNYSPSYITVTGGGAMPDTINGVVLSCDGTGATDVTTDIQAALDDAASQGKALLIPATAGYYKVSDKLNVNCSVMGIGGMPTIKQTNDLTATLLILDDMTGWIYNLHIVGTYDGTPSPPVTNDFGHNIAVRGVNGLTISNNILETPIGDNIGDEGGQQKPLRNMLITNNSLLDPWRCNISATAVVDRVAIMNNVLTYNSQYVDPIDIEPYQDASFTTNIEVGYNDIQSPKPALTGDGLHYYEAILQVTAWWDETPGGNIFSHHNWGDWGAPFTQITGYQGGPSTWTNILSINNEEGATIPGDDVQAPAVVTGLTVSDVNKSSISLAWADGTDNVGVTGYVVYQDGVLVGLTDSTAYEATGLICGMAYGMKVKSYDAAGNTSPATMAYNAATLDCAGGKNLLLNPGFEERLTNWNDWGGTALDSTVVRSGTYSLRTGPGDAGRAQSFPEFLPGGTYILSTYGMLSGTGFGNFQKSYIGADIRDAGGVRIIAETSPAITDSLEWGKYSVTFTVPAEATKIDVFVYLEANGNPTNSVLTDDWSLIEFTPATGISVNPATVSLPVGIVQKVKAVFEPIDATDQAVSWSSSDTLIAKVDATGLIQGMAEGMTTISALSADGGFVGTTEVTVTAPTANMLKNAGIEQALSTGWAGDWGNNSVNSTEFHSGAKSLAIGLNDGGRAQQLLGFIPGSTYTFSAWGKFIGNGGFSTQAAYIGADTRDASNVRIAIPTAGITDSLDWAQSSFTFTVPLNAASINVYVYLETRGITGNYVLTDDWAVISGWEPLPFVKVGIKSNQNCNLNLYPNPVIGQLLNIEGAEDSQSISIFDMTGRLVFTEDLQGFGKQTVNLNNKVQKGSYIVKVAGKSGSNSQLLLVE